MEKAQAQFDLLDDDDDDDDDLNLGGQVGVCEVTAVCNETDDTWVLDVPLDSKVQAITSCLKADLAQASTGLKKLMRGGFAFRLCDKQFRMMRSSASISDFVTSKKKAQFYVLLCEPNA